MPPALLASSVGEACWGVLLPNRLVVCFPLIGGGVARYGGNGLKPNRTKNVTPKVHRLSVGLLLVQNRMALRHIFIRKTSESLAISVKDSIFVRVFLGVMRPFFLVHSATPFWAVSPSKMRLTSLMR